MAAQEAISPPLHGELESAWGGGRAPFGMGAKKLGMWLFIIADAVAFAALLTAYCYVRVASPNWPAPFGFYPVLVKAAVMTFMLLSSSVAMVMAVHAARRQRRAGAVKWIAATVVGGALFVIVQGTEWAGLWGEGVRPYHNPWGSPLFGASFFTLTGLHMIHVVCGVFYLAMVAGGFGKGKLRVEDVEVAGLYWQFVDVVWLFIVALVYIW